MKVYLFATMAISVFALRPLPLYADSIQHFSDYRLTIEDRTFGAISATGDYDIELEIDHKRNVATPLLAKPDPDFANGLFTLDVEKLVADHGAEDFLSVKRAFYKAQKFSKWGLKYSRPYVYLSDWRSLFHPPIRTLSLAREVYGKKFAAINHEVLGQGAFFTDEFHHKLDALTQTEMTAGNQVSLLSNGENSFREKLRMVKSAKKYFYSAVMVQYCDETGSQMVDALIERAQAGVDVRLVVENLWTRLTLSSCLKKLRKGGVKVTLATGALAPKTFATVMHDKFWIRDGEEAIMGGQNMHDFENLSNGFNGRTRDRDVLIKRGPAVSDLVVEFGRLWNYFHKKPDPTLTPALNEAAIKIQQERTQGLRGRELYQQWLDDPASKDQGLCRVVVQGNQTSRKLISQAYLEIIKNVRHNMLIDTLSLRFNDKNPHKDMGSTIVKLIMDRARAGVSVDIVSNGIDAGMGENGRKLKELAQKFKAKGKKTLAKMMASIERTVALFYSSPNHKALAKMAKVPNIEAWEYFNHIHSKQIVFDHILTSTGSFNLDKHSYKNHESTLICLDKTLAEQSIDGFVSDIVNSVPVF